VFHLEKNYFITITGVNHYYSMKPFEPGRIVKLIKENDNEHDEEAICVVLPFIDKVGYVANSPNTVAKGTYSAGRVYDLFEKEIYAKVLFITHSSVICILELPETETETREPVEETEVADEPKTEVSEVSEALDHKEDRK
jgi:hypothetical protein